jgi:DNA integrity scanning protein DisA with diadenylate cyclase activity
MKSLQEQFLNQSASAVNTNTEVTKVMGKNIVKAELVVNITLSANNILSEGTMAKAQAKKGVIINTRSAGTLRYNTNDSSVYADFYPLPNTINDKLGKYNCAVWKLTDDQGNTEVLSHESALEVWAHALNVTPEQLAVNEIALKVKVNFDAQHTFASVNQSLKAGVIRSYSIIFTDIDNMFEDVLKVDTLGREYCELHPYVNSCTVDFNRTVTELTTRSIGLTGLTMDVVRAAAVERKTDFSRFLKAKPTKSSARREDRKASATSKVADTIVFDGASAPKVDAATAAAAPVVVPQPEVAPAITVQEVLIPKTDCSVVAEEIKPAAPMTDAESIKALTAARKAKRNSITFDSPVSTQVQAAKIGAANSEPEPRTSGEVRDAIDFGAENGVKGAKTPSASVSQAMSREEMEAILDMMDDL